MALNLTYPYATLAVQVPLRPIRTARILSPLVTGHSRRMISLIEQILDYAREHPEVLYNFTGQLRQVLVALYEMDRQDERGAWMEEVSRSWDVQKINMQFNSLAEFMRLQGTPGMWGQG